MQADAREARVVLTVEVATASPVSVANELSSPTFTAVLSDELGVKTVFSVPPEIEFKLTIPSPPPP